MKLKVAEQSGLSVTDDDILLPQSSKKKRKRGRAKKGRKWKVGDRCRARFSDDQCLYEAEILSVDDSSGTCFVRYTGYGNEEEHNIKDLQRVHRHKEKHADTENETDSGVDGRSGRSSQPNSHSASRPHMMPPGWGGPAPSAAYPGHMFSGMPPPPPPPSFFSMPGIPFMPPPPPPPAFEEMSHENSEALCSMLMSWYMSGYHTGYYQGLQAKKFTGASNPFTNR